MRNEVRRIAVDVVARTADSVGESPRWDVHGAVVRWVDIPGRSLHACDLDGRRVRSVATDRMIGSIVPAIGGRWAAAAEGGFYDLDVDTGALELIAAVKAAPGMRMNDGACDPAGRFWAGSMAIDGRAHAGVLWCLSGVSLTPHLTNLTIPNGIDWSPDGSRLYYVDSATHRIDVYDFDLDSGSLKNGRALANIVDGLPDGLTVDADGRVWVAVWGAGQVRCFDDRGRLVAVVDIPTPQVTSCAFGGERLDTLFVTTAADGIAADDPDFEGAGALFACEPGAVGRAPRVHDAGA